MPVKVRYERQQGALGTWTSTESDRRCAGR